MGREKEEKEEKEVCQVGPASHIGHRGRERRSEGRKKEMLSDVSVRMNLENVCGQRRTPKTPQKTPVGARHVIGPQEFANHSKASRQPWV